MQPNTPECSVGLPIWCENTPTLTSTAFPLAPYLLRELMNFSLARLLTSFEAPSFGLLHLLTPVAGVCSPEKKQMGNSFACVVESEFRPPFRGQPIGAKELFTPFLKMEWGEIPQRVKLYCERTDLTRLYFQLSYFVQSAVPFHYKLPL